MLDRAPPHLAEQPPKAEKLQMESINPHALVMLGVVIVHLIGVTIVAAAAAAVMTAVSTGALAVRTIRRAWTWVQPPVDGTRRL